VTCGDGCAARDSNPEPADRASAASSCAAIGSGAGQRRRGGSSIMVGGHPCSPVSRHKRRVQRQIDHALLGAVTRARMVLARRRRRPGRRRARHDHQRPRDPLTSTVSRRTRRARNIDASARVHGSIHSHTFRRKERRARSTVMLDAGSVWVAVKDGLDSAVCFSGM